MDINGYVSKIARMIGWDTNQKLQSILICKLFRCFHSRMGAKGLQTIGERLALLEILIYPSFWEVGMGWINSSSDMISMFRTPYFFFTKIAYFKTAMWTWEPRFLSFPKSFFHTPLGSRMAWLNLGPPLQATKFLGLPALQVTACI